MTATRILTEDEILARVLYRDAMMLVIDKPAGIAVHATGHDKLALDQSFHHLQFGLPKKPELAHRLDRGTSGCLVLGRHRQALIKLGKMFEQKKIEKSYLAVVVGMPAEAEGVIDRPILKSGHGSLWTLSLDPAGQEAVTHYRTLKTNGTLSLLEMSPKTGRTHQLRLHAAYALGCPIVGDPFYSKSTAFAQPKKAGEILPRHDKTARLKFSEAEMADPFSAAHYPMMLHAERITIPLYHSKPAIEVTAPVPEGMSRIIAEIKG
jgi:tRNA pseudouridine32 synthase/23S rRNA pseudouridine746 synthase